ncbi:MAG: hypothetical protein A2W90_17620 [Bacteroidetes bacterium GWF2_42_66]|nr:MAG: hypothetical protein A2W92_16725 [Bacteroidetes bacterium GWA2_42_15]OFX98078.1 MAG: hypothetical protein A2W89_09110 [Bacteroidetes bacterium GWE2_42_39]OFY42461.1 MAG: hypothetical protein A2W90_17620 [Bacteroidetes bacterium GWF2_42_66]HBL74172.1 hypothetical protein [Prolixibacteraceae bacterium]HCR91658.1 hypothetical protein [Prolixibacteraceae bacterium]
MNTRALKFMLCVAFYLLIGVSFFSCDNDDDSVISWPKGEFNHSKIQQLEGFWEQKPALLTAANMSVGEFIEWSTDSAWSLAQTERAKLRIVRDGITTPSASTLLEKVITLQDVPVYMNNTYGGTVGGFVSAAADIKSLSTMYDVYYGTRLDYPGTKFLPDGAGYAVIRFTSSNVTHLEIPYCTEMGGTFAHAWPNTGGGFTSSTLGDGGFPEYRFDNYYAPDQGAELYEVTPLGNEILRATFEGMKWVTTEPATKSAVKWGSSVRNGVYGGSVEDLSPVITFSDGRKQILNKQGEYIDYTGDLFYVSTVAEYKNFSMRVWRYDEQHYLLTISDFQAFSELNLDLIERGVYGKIVLSEEAGNLHEEISRQ